MADLEIKLNSAGIRELLKSAEIASVCEEQAARMTRATGVEYVSDVHVGRTRVNAAGYSGSIKAESTESREGREVHGYYRTLKNGKTIYVQSYRRKK